ncbi:hypothetical protein [Enterobacter cloacae complex sp. P6RS]
MIAPYDSYSYSLPNSINGKEITWQIINDFGGSSKKYKALIF